MRGDILGRLVGMLVFIGGVCLLILVFVMAYRLFNASPTEALGIRITGDPKRDPAMVTLGAQVTWLIFRIIYLAFMSVAGSLIANKGIHLYFSSHASKQGSRSEELG